MTKEELSKEGIRLQEELRKLKKVDEDVKRKMYRMRTRLCINCHKEVFTRHVRCPFCHQFTTTKYEQMSNSKKDRNDEIITKLQTGKYTLVQLGEEYGVSRERIRQLYQKVTGRGYTVGILTRKEQRKRKREEYLSSIKLYCAGCNTPVTYREGNRKKLYCTMCSHQRMDNCRDMKVKKICCNCGKSFSPFNNITAPSQKGIGIFHDMTCYFDVIHLRTLLRSYYKGEEFIF